MIPGETINSGASPECEDCGLLVVLDIYMSGAGYYIGSYCDCGPYSRESAYYQTYEDANEDFQSNTWLAR